MSHLDLDRWVWQVHEVGVRVSYGTLRPPVPVESSSLAGDCTAESAKAQALNIVIDKNYERAAMENIEPLLTQAGYRLAGLLNQVWQ